MRPCGCPEDYHLNDCPILRPPIDEPDDYPDDYDVPTWNESD